MIKLKFKDKEYSDCIHVSTRGRLGFKARMSALFSVSYSITSKVYTESLPGRTDADDTILEIRTVWDWFKGLFQYKGGWETK